MAWEIPIKCKISGYTVYFLKKFLVYDKCHSKNCINVENIMMLALSDHLTLWCLYQINLSKDTNKIIMDVGIKDLANNGNCL